jgi:tetratricopeptide (TPR) repeat protein
MALTVAVTAIALMPIISRPAALVASPRAVIRACTLEPDLGSSLQSTFEMALAHQRAGDPDGALARYELFVQAAEQVAIPPLTYAEVLVNMGTIYAKRRNSARAREFFERALRLRELSSAHLNLALLELAAGSESRKGQMPVEALVNAERHCQRAIFLGDDPSSFAMAQQVLHDIERSKRV